MWNFVFVHILIFTLDIVYVKYFFDFGILQTYLLTSKKYTIISKNKKNTQIQRLPVKNKGRYSR